MKNLVKIGLIRLYKHWFYIVGCILAFVITVWFLETRPIPQLAHHSAESVAILLSGAIIVYFSMFIGIFMGSEAEDGILRNKVMAGHTQLEVYVSHYVTFLLALIGMLVCWFLGAMVGGTQVTADFIEYTCIAFLYNAAYIAIIQAIVFRMKKMVSGVVLGLGIFYFLAANVLISNYIYMVLSDMGQPIMVTLFSVIYNMSAVGQCFARTALADPGLGTTGVQVSVSLGLIVLASLLGTLKLKKRDIK